MAYSRPQVDSSEQEQLPGPALDATAEEATHQSPPVNPALVNSPEPTSEKRRSKDGHPEPTERRTPDVKEEQTRTRRHGDPDVKQLMKRISQLEADNDRLVRERDEARQERMRRDAEVDSLRMFAMAQDISHGADALNLIETINNEASTFAGELAENWDLPEKKGPIRVGDNPTVMDVALARCDVRQPQGRLLLQLAFQANIIHYVHWILERSSYGLDERSDRFVQKLHKKVQGLESQPNFARWRAITYKSILENSVDQEKQKTLTTQICDELVASFEQHGSLLTGRGLPDDDFNEMAKDTRSAMEDIISKSLQLANMVRTEILSANFVHYWPTGNDFNPEYMTMPHAQTVPTGKDKVEMTSGLGLLRHEKLGREMVDGAKQVWTISLKAQVLTQNEISAILSSSSSVSRPSSYSEKQGRKGSELLRLLVESPLGWIFTALRRFFQSLLFKTQSGR